MNVVSLADHDRDILGQALECLPSPYTDLETFLLDVWPLFVGLPRPALAATRALRNDPAAPGALLVRNLPVDSELPPTPNTGAAEGDRRTFVTEGCALG